MVLKYHLRLYVLTLAVLVSFSALASRLWDLSVRRHDEFKNRVRGVKILRARIPGARGEIKDRNGFTLVANKASFEVQVNLKMLVDDYKRQLAEDNRGKPKAERRDIPVRMYQYPDRGFMREKQELDIVTIVNDAIVEPLNALGLSAGFNAKQLMVQYRTNRGVVPWVYRGDLSFEEFSRFAEHRLGLSGLTVSERPTRQYLFDSMACHVLGYVQQADEKRVSDEERKEWDFYVPDDFGVYGVEKAFDNELRGRPGEVKLIQDERGHIIAEQERTDPMRGHDVWLTLDARIQYIAERALRESNPAIGRGAVVVLQPATGEVLAMASVPSFNPNKFIPSITKADYQAYTENKTTPLINRALSAYAPGSTYKVAISFAGILAGTEKSYFTCNGSVRYGNKDMHCWIAQKGGSHGTLDLAGGLKNSCNCYFFQYGNKAGIENIAKAGHMFGLGEKTGIELTDEDPGILPTRQWLKAHKPNVVFSQAVVANTSIGQGDVLATPLQMACVTAAVGNGGVCYRPHLLKYLKDDQELVSEQKPDIRGNFSDYGLTQQKLELVRKGMWKVVNEEGGTGRGGHIDGVEVAGKTGTAEAWRPDGVKDNHTLFICFAPYVNPKYAVCILVEGGKSGGGCSAPIAKRILQQAIDMDKGYKVTPEPVKEVTGNFNHIETVSFEGIASNATNPDQDNDTGAGGDEPPKPKPTQDSKPKVPHANVRAEADEEGSRAVKKTDAPPPRRPGFFQRIFGH